MRKQATSFIPAERIESAILLIRGHKVLLDAVLAALYTVETRVLVQAVQRNRGRFPEDFMFRLSWAETRALRSQIVILDAATGGGRSGLARASRRGRFTKYPPYAFTEQGVAMLSSVLRSERAIQVNIAIMRTFVRIRKILASHAEIARKLDALERKYDAQFKVVFDAIRGLMAPEPAPRKPRIGFRPRRSRS